MQNDYALENMGTYTYLRELRRIIIFVFVVGE